MQPILTMNLSTGEKSDYIIPEAWERGFLGGASLAARLLYDELTVLLDPLSPEAPLLFLNGPLSGTSGPAVGRFVVCGRSPYTHLWGESNVGGFWGPELRKAGYDGLWLRGRAEKLSYLWIHDGVAELRPAEHLRGLDTYETQQAVAADLGDVGKGASILVIGPAGEALVPYALLLTDHGRAGGRTGMGALMGSKNLKAVAVKGTGRVPVLDMEAYHPRRTEANRGLRADAMSSMLRDLGTAGGADYFDYLGTMPKKYFSRGTYDEEIKVSGATVKENLLVGVSACHACVIACGRVVRLPEAEGTPGENPGDQPGDKRKGPEYETLVGFGPNLMLNDAVFVTRMGELCDRGGVDSISMSGTIGMALRLWEMGKINETDTDGMRLEWGSGEAVEWCVRETLKGEGFGALLAQGSRALGRHFGAEDEAVQVNGLETGYHDPRGASGMALVYASSPRGACHNQSDYFLVDVGQVEPSLGMETYDRQGGAEKAGNVAVHQDWRTVFNSLVMCVFSNLDPETVVGLINAALKYDWTVHDLLRCGERGWNLKRMINQRLGLTRANDTLPKAMRQPYSDGAAGGFAPDLEAMLQAYYRARGWDEVTGMPTEEKLKELGLPPD